MIRKRGKNVRKIEEISGDGCRCACYIGNDSDFGLPRKYFRHGE
jgi:hypothetical protein